MSVPATDKGGFVLDDQADSAVVKTTARSRCSVSKGGLTMYQDVKVGFKLISAVYKDSQRWEIQIQLTSQIFGGPFNKTLVSGTTFVDDLCGELTPAKVFTTAVQQILKGDRNWRPILCHDQER
jgi:hypothetical protein